MLITFLRHATAEPQALTINDAERALVKKGHEQVLRVAQFCRKNDLLPSVFFCSPILRARQTAELFQNHLPDCPPVNAVEWLGLGISTAVMIAELQKLERFGVNNVWLVGHEPDISRLIAAMLRTPGECILIKKASLTRLHADLSQLPMAQLLWSMPCALMK